MQRLHVEADQVTNVEREKTKRVVYAVVYGVGKLTFIMYVLYGDCKEISQGKIS